MIRFLLAVIIVLALVGGAVKFESSDESWQIIIHKEDALHSIQNGAINIYNVVKDFLSDADSIETSTLIIEK